MRAITLLTIGALIATPALGQNSSGGDGTSPQNRGSTGWTGAHPESGGSTVDQSKPKAEPGKAIGATTGQSVGVHDDAEAKNQPAIATGQDLGGPARQLPPSKTPE